MMLIHATLLWLIAALSRGAVGDDPTTRKKPSVKKRLSVLEALAPHTSTHLDWADDHRDFTAWVGDNQFDEEPFTTYLTVEWFRNLEDKLSGIQDTLQNVQNDIQSMESRQEGIDGRLEGIDGRLERMGSRLKRFHMTCANGLIEFDGLIESLRSSQEVIFSRVSVIEDTTPANIKYSLYTIERRLSGTEMITDQLQCSASERLQPVCKARVWVTVVAGGGTRVGGTDAVQVIGGDSSLVLPSITLPVYNNRITTIGTTLYSSGGYNSNIGTTTASVYSLDLTGEHNTWQTSHPLPRASRNHHTSGANGVIMAIYEDGSISITNGSESASYEGVFDQGTRHWQSCLAHNATHSYYLHRGIVYMNNNAINPTDWKNISYLNWDSNNYGTACFLFESDLFVTQTDTLFIMNTDTFSVREGASPNTPRQYHGMGVINDRVAVLGGSGNNGILDSIETYDRQTNTWQTVKETLWQPMYAFGIASVLY